MSLILKAVGAAVAAVLPSPAPGVNPAATEDHSRVATPRLAFVNGRLAQWYAYTDREGGEWVEVPAIVAIETDPETPPVTNSDPPAPA